MEDTASRQGISQNGILPHVKSIAQNNQSIVAQPLPTQMVGVMVMKLVCVPNRIITPPSSVPQWPHRSALLPQGSPCPALE